MEYHLIPPACSTRYRLVERLLQVRTIIFSSDRLWLHENGSLCCRWLRICLLRWQMLGSVSKHMINIILLGWEQIHTAQIQSFGGNQGKCDRTCNSSDVLFSPVLMRQDLHVADISFISWNEAYEHSLFLPYLLLSMPCVRQAPWCLYTAYLA